MPGAPGSVKARALLGLNVDNPARVALVVIGAEIYFAGQGPFPVLVSLWFQEERPAI